MKDALKNTFRISRLVAEDIAGCLDDAGRQELECWLQESDENQATYREIKEELESGRRELPYSEKQVDQQLAMFHQRRAKGSWRSIVWWRYAAVLILFVSI